MTSKIANVRLMAKSAFSGPSSPGALLTVLILILTTFGGAASAQGQLYVTNWWDNTVTVYPRVANGNVPPTMSIYSGVYGPHQIASIPGANEIVVSYYVNSTVRVYDADTGAVKRTLQGSQTGLVSPIGIAVDEAHGELVVSNFGTGTLTVYAINADGDVPPLRVIGSPSPELQPVGVAVDLARDEIVATYNYYQVPASSRIAVFPRTASGNVAPIRTIVGPATGLYLPQGIAVDAATGEIVVANSFYTLPNRGQVRVFDGAASGDVAPVRVLEGPGTGLCTPIGLTIDRVHNELLVANSNYGGGTCAASVTVYDWPAAPTASGSFDQVPLRAVGGPSSGVNAPFSVAVIPGALPAPTISGADLVAEATTPAGAIVTFIATAVDFAGSPLALDCGSIVPGTPALFPMGLTAFSCAAVDRFGQISQREFTVRVVDTTPPAFAGIRNIAVEALGPQDVSWDDVTATDLGQTVPYVCSPPSGSTFDFGTSTVTCWAVDAAGNRAQVQFTVTVTLEQTPLPGGSCFVVDFREITYFRYSTVLTSSDAGIRARNGIDGGFAPSVWPYPSLTKSRGVLFRIYGFRPTALNDRVPNEDNPGVTYPVVWDADANAFYIDLGGPARVRICPDQLHEYVLTGQKGNGHKNNSALLPKSQRNVPGVMLTHNQQIVKLPKRVRAEMAGLGLPSDDRGMIQYIGVQHQGHGDGKYREFVDVRISFPGDSETDRLQHFMNGFHTALNTNFESFAGCNYLDHAPGNDGVRLRDVWGPNRSAKQGYRIWEPCGAREPVANQAVRANFEVPFNGVQILSTVNTGTDTLRVFFGSITMMSETERKRRDHKLVWSGWEAEDQ